jgi:hypothetical protein
MVLGGFDWTWLFEDSGRNFATVVSAMIAAATASFAMISLVVVLRTYRRSAIDKNTEVALKVEETYRKELATMLACEYLPEYNRTFLPALVKSVAASQWQLLGPASGQSGTERLSQEEFDAIHRLESMLRHFYFALKTLEANPSLKSLLENAEHYLTLFTRDSEERPDLRDYIELYWQTVFKSGMKLQKKEEHKTTFLLNKRLDPTAVHDEEIAKRAFQIRLGRGSGHGQDQKEDLRLAEEELRRECRALRDKTEKDRGAWRREIARVRKSRLLRWLVAVWRGLGNSFLPELADPAPQNLREDQQNRHNP